MPDVKNPEGLFINTQYFKEEANRFLSEGQYCSAPPGTSAYFDYWNEQIRRCIEGYSVGGVRITGDHYFYLNFYQIKLTKEDNQTERVSKTSKQKQISFPDFWDVDYNYFHTLEIAQHGITPQDLEDLQLYWNIQDLNGNLHLSVLKARRKGFSFKNSAIADKNFYLVPKSKSFFIAYAQTYLTDADGVMPKCWDNLDFINQNTAWRKHRQKKDTDLHKRASYIQNGDEKGFKSEIIGIPIGERTDKARGLDANYVFVEEAGAFPNLKNVLSKMRPSVEEGIYTTGTIIMFGTGGSKGSDFESMEEIHNNPHLYKILPIENVFDDGAQGTNCGLFIPDYWGKKGFIDSNGNSDTVGAEKYEMENREQIKRDSKDTGAISRYIAERPFSPREATLKPDTNIFPTDDLIQWKSIVENRYPNEGAHGIFMNRGNGIEFKMDNQYKPVKFPHTKDHDLTGCATIYHAPFRTEDKKVPPGLYFICHDPYASDSVSDNTHRPSLGCAYVMKRLNNFSKPDDIIVASYVGRPSTQEAFNQQMFRMAMYYNAKISFENDRGDVVGYARRHGMLNYLAGEFDMIEKKGSDKLNGTFGVSMNGKDRKEQGQIYVRDWLVQPRGEDKNGNPVLNLHKIFDINLLEELKKFSMDGNFDRVSTLMVGTAYQKSLYNKEFEKKLENKNDDFFKRSFFSD
jgi:hypothetical protein